MNLLWVDANGLVLGTVAELDYSGGGLLLDSNGWFWLVDLNTARVGATISLGRFYIAPDCVGAAYVSAYPEVSQVRPRWVTSVLGTGGLFARGDQQQVEVIRPVSYSDGAVCSLWQGTYTVIRFDQMRSVPPLTINPVGPVHVERR